MKGHKRKLLTVILTITLIMSNLVVVNAEGKATMIQKQSVVEGHTAINAEKTTSAVLNVKRQDDSFQVYDLTTVTWDDSTGVLNAKIEWNDAVKTFLNGNASFTDDKYSSPEKLGKADDESAVITLLRAMREDTALMTELQSTYLAAYHTGSGDVNTGNSTADGTKTPVKQAAVLPDIGNTDGAQTFHNAYTISGLQYGLYFIDAKGTSREYQPVLLDLMPVQTGPTGNWYVKNDLSASLKYEDIEVTKTINKDKEDVVREGELVSFDITSEIPKYVQDEGGNYVGGNSLFNAFDIMEKGYGLVATSAKISYEDENGNRYYPAAKTTIENDGSVTITDTENTFSAILLEDSTVYYLAGNDTEDVFYSTPTQSSGYAMFWGKLNGELISLGNYLEGNPASYSAALDTLNSKREGAGLAKIPSGTITARAEHQSLLSVHFNYTTLMDAQTYAGVSNTTGFTVPDKFYISYDAQVNTNFVVGEDTNTNKVVISYVGDSTGKIDTVEAEVKAWTYAAKITKIDGTTKEYLEGAIFDLYRLDTVYCGGENATTVPTETDYETYTFYEDANNEMLYANSFTAWQDTLKKAVQYNMSQQGVTDQTAIDAKAAEVLSALTNAGGYEKASDFQKKYSPLTGNTEYAAILEKWVLPKVQSGSMLYQAIPVKVSSCTEVSKEHYHLQYYSTMWTGIESAKIAQGQEGVTLTGLDPNTYLLVETQAPDGYNKMTGALQFAVQLYDNGQYTAAGNSYKGFVRDDGQDEVDGVYDIEVENFQGIQLPSTGGIGTLLFTIIGIAIMFTAIIVIVMKSRKKRYEYK